MQSGVLLLWQYKKNMSTSRWSCAQSMLCSRLVTSSPGLEQSYMTPHSWDSISSDIQLGFVPSLVLGGLQSWVAISRRYDRSRWRRGGRTGRGGRGQIARNEGSPVLVHQMSLYMGQVGGERCGVFSSLNLSVWRGRRESSRYLHVVLLLFPGSTQNKKHLCTCYRCL